MGSLTVCIFFSNININSPFLFTIAYYFITIIFYFVRTSKNKTFCWQVFTTSHLFMFYTTIYHIYQTWSSFSISFHYFNNSFKLKTRCAKLFWFGFSFNYNHNNKTSFVTNFLRLSKTAFIYKQTRKTC